MQSQIPGYQGHLLHHQVPPGRPKLYTPESSLDENILLLNLRASQMVLIVKKLSASEGDKRVAGSLPGSGRSPGGGHGNSRILACRIPWTEEPGSLQSRRLQKSWTRVKWLSAHLNSCLQRQRSCWMLGPISSPQADSRNAWKKS